MAANNEIPNYWELTDTDTSFFAEAVCRTTKEGRAVDFFSYRAKDVRAAKNLCCTCPVKQRCYEYGRNNGMVAIVYGGESMPLRVYSR